MDLILWRHAEAFEMREVDDDLARALTPKGERQAQRMASWLNRQLPSTTKVLASPARRCQQTAAALERKVKTVADLAPEATVEALLHAVRWPESREPVLVVGHQGFSRGRRWPAASKPAQGSRFCRARRCGRLAMVKAAGSSFAVTSRQASGVATVAPGRARGE